jgi:pimeloyl-ACP methyl ester carboxylesterase
MAGPSTTPTTGSDRIVPIVGGAVVSVAEHGDPKGWPVLCFHGTPASRLGFGYTDGPARELGVRILCPDRPGVGGSTAVPLPSIGAYAAHIAQLADALGLERFAVLGYSGGGPYALATALLLPDRVGTAATMAGVAPLDWPGAERGLEALDLRIGRWSRDHPHRARAALRATAFALRHAPGLAAKGFRATLGVHDRAALDHMDVAHGGFDFAVEAFRQGIDGVFGDYRRWVEPWEVPLGSTPVPIHLWQGDDDHVVPMSHAEHLTEVLPSAVLHRLPGAGHVSIQEAAPAILAALAPPPAGETDDAAGELSAAGD